MTNSPNITSRDELLRERTLLSSREVARIIARVAYPVYKLRDWQGRGEVS